MKVSSDVLVMRGEMMVDDQCVANDAIGEGNFDAGAENKAAGNATTTAEAPSKKKKGTSKKAKSVKEKLAIVDGA